MKRKAFLVFVWCLINPIYGQINFVEKERIYDFDLLSVELIYDDFDNDNDIDIIKVQPYNQKNVVLQKNENGNLNKSLPKLISTGVNPIISMDLNNDDYPDLITYYSYNTIGVLYNLQNDTFSSQQTLLNFTGSYSISPIKLDYDNDGFIDLIVKDNQHNAYVLINNQNGGFLPKQLLLSLSGSFASIYKIEDFDNDGDFDIYVFDYNLKIYINNNGNFVTGGVLQISTTPVKEYGILDIDQNGYKDVLYWNNGAIWAKYFGLTPNTNQITALSNTAVVENIPYNYMTNNSNSIYVKNTNTGIYDVYIALETAQNESNIYKFNVNNGIFSSAEVVLSNFDINIFYQNDYQFIDFNNNGDIDFSFTSDFNSQNMIHINYDIDNLIDKTICIQQCIIPDEFTVIDMNGDGIEDLCVGNQNGLGYYEKMENNEQKPIKNLIGVMSNPNASTFTLNHIVDFDNDGLGDVIDYSQSDMYAKVFKNLGNDNFLFIENITIPILTTGIYFLDIDSDGYKDLLFKKNPYTTGDVLLWAKNNNGINFEDVQSLSVNYPNDIDPISLSFNDFNNDGATDIALLNNYYSNDTFNYEIVLLENQNGSFSATNLATLIGDYSQGKIKVKDIDQDGHLDIFVYDTNSRPFLLYKNDGQNNFYKKIIDNIAIYDIDFDDNDGDGIYEIYAMNCNPGSYIGNVFYYRTLNFLNFSKINIDTYEAPNDSRGDLLLFDYNNDNKKDLFVINPDFLNGLISVFMSNSNTLAIEDTDDNNNLKVFPNPFTDSINWNEGDNKNYKLQLFSLNGKLIHEEKTSNNNIDFSFLESGTYILVIEDAGIHSKNTYKIIKK